MRWKPRGYKEKIPCVPFEHESHEHVSGVNSLSMYEWKPGSTRKYPPEDDFTKNRMKLFLQFNLMSGVKSLQIY